MGLQWKVHEGNQEKGQKGQQWAKKPIQKA